MGRSITRRTGRRRTGRRRTGRRRTGRRRRRAKRLHGGKDTLSFLLEDKKEG